MSFQGGDDSLQLFDDSSRGFDDSPGPGKIWLHDIPILLRAGPMCLGDGPKFLCAGTFSVPVRGSSIQPYLKGSDLTGAIAAQAQAGGGTARLRTKSVACWMVCCVGSRNTFRRTVTMTCSSC